MQFLIIKVGSGIPLLDGILLAEIGMAGNRPRVDRFFLKILDSLFSL
jgi:hypothetical protein